MPHDYIPPADLERIFADEPADPAPLVQIVPVISDRVAVALMLLIWAIGALAVASV